MMATAPEVAEAYPGLTVELHADDPVLDQMIEDALAEGTLLVQVTGTE